jgi:hypothetical protein
MAPSTAHAASFPNELFTLAVVSAYSWLFTPSRDTSLWYVYTPARSVTATVDVAVCVGFAALVATMVCTPVLPAVYRPVELMVPTLELPPAIASTVQVAAPPPGTVAVNCCVRVSVIAAAQGSSRRSPR